MGQMFVLCVVLGAALLKVFKVLSFAVLGQEAVTVIDGAVNTCNHGVGGDDKRSPFYF